MGWSVPKRYDFERPEPRLGAGLSRPLVNQSTRLYGVSVKVPGAPAMRVTIPAPSREKALLYCRNRWPDCQAEVIE